MGKFAETAIVDYRLSYANQGKQTSIFRFRFLFVADKRKSPFSVSSVKVSAEALEPMFFFVM